MQTILLLKTRNEVLFWFGLANLLLVVIMLVASWIKPLEFAGINAWFKPIKFALSTTILSWSLAWYTGYLPAGNNITVFNWVIVLTLAFEVIYISWQAARGQASHFNQSTPFYTAMYSLMALAATAATLAVAYLGVLFFMSTTESLPDYYLWAIRLGILLFVVFSFEGFAMGGRLAHTVGAADGGKGLPFLNWSIRYGDLRVAHFIGMHALQVIPLLAWFVLKDIKWTIGFSVLYALLAVFVLVQALRGRALVGISLSR